MLGFGIGWKVWEHAQEIIINDYSKLYIQLIAGKEKNTPFTWLQKAEIIAKDSEAIKYMKKNYIIIISGSISYLIFILR